MSQSQFVKLYSSILESSIWFERPEIKIVWITLLLSCDADGCVYSTIPGIANKAAVSPEDVEQALEIFQQADRFSRTKESDGKRIETIDGGWRLLNYSKYRAHSEEERRKEYHREYIAKYRAEGKDKTRSGKQLVNTGKPLPSSGEHLVNPPFSPPSSPPSTPLLTPSQAPIYVEGEAVNIGKCLPAPLPPNQGTNAPTLKQAVEYFESIKSDYTRKEIKACWSLFNGTARDGIWFFGRSPVGDWRSIMEFKMGELREHNNGGHSILDLKTALGIKEARAAELKAMHCSQTATGGVWDGETHREQYRKLKGEIKGLQAKIEAMV